MDVSVILVSYNTKDMTRECLESVYRFTKDIEFEVFVVDNNSKDGSAEMIEREFPQVRLIRNPDNKGFGAANNIAIRKSSAKYIFCLNTDTLLLNNSIKEFFDFMEKSENENVGACGCQLLDKDMKLQHSYGCLPRISRIVLTLFGVAQIFPKWYKKKYFHSPYENDTEPYEVEYVTGADLFMRKSVLDRVGIFDENFFMYFEESELQKRMHEIGYKSIMLPKLNIVHYCGMPNENVPLAKVKIFRTSEFYYYEKCNGKIARLFVKMLYLIRYLFCIKFDKSYFENILLYF